MKAEEMINNRINKYRQCSQRMLMYYTMLLIRTLAKSTVNAAPLPCPIIYEEVCFHAYQLFLCITVT